MSTSERALSYHVKQTCHQSAAWKEGEDIISHTDIFICNVNAVQEEIYVLLLLLQVNWHDFAFFDPVMYESLRQLIRHSQAGEADAVFAAMDLAFAIDLCKEEGAGQVRNHTNALDFNKRGLCDLNLVDAFILSGSGGASLRWGQHACDTS